MLCSYVGVLLVLATPMGVFGTGEKDLKPLASETTFFYNKADGVDLSLTYYTNQYGSFDQKPPQSADSGSTADWTMDADIFHSFGWMEYDVYYKGPFSGCLHLSYLWDLVFGTCGSGFVDSCPGNGNNTTGTKKVRGNSTTPFVDPSGNVAGTLHIADDCGAWSNPVHTLTITSEASPVSMSVLV